MEKECVICRNKNTALEDRHLSLYRCRQCGYVFKQLLKPEQEKYDRDYYSFHKNWFSYPDYPLFEFLRLYGIDFIENQYPGVQFIQGDIFTAGLEDKFDIICSLAVIEHLDQPHLFVQRIKELLRPGGLVFTVTDNIDGMIYTTAQLLRKAGRSCAYNRLYKQHHLQDFSRKSLRLLMQAHNLDILLQKNHNHPVEAVDYPKANPLTMICYILGVRTIFLLSSLFGAGILQIVIAKHK